jgi:glycosyltransferase involved in cell wall biosynthesis
METSAPVLLFDPALDDSRVLDDLDQYFDVARIGKPPSPLVRTVTVDKFQTGQAQAQSGRVVFFLYDVFDYEDLRSILTEASAATICAADHLVGLLERDPVLAGRPIVSPSEVMRLGERRRIGAGDAAVACLSAGAAAEDALRFGELTGATTVCIAASPYSPHLRTPVEKGHQQLRDRLDRFDLVLANGLATAAAWPVARFGVIGADCPTTRTEQGGAIVVNFDFTDVDRTRRKLKHASRWLDRCQQAIADLKYRIRTNTRFIRPPHCRFSDEEMTALGLSIARLSAEDYLAALQGAAVVVTPYSRAIGVARRNGAKVIYFNPNLDSVPALNHPDSCGLIRCLTWETLTAAIKRPDAPATPARDHLRDLHLGRATPTRGASALGKIGRAASAAVREPRARRRPAPSEAPRIAMFAKMPTDAYSGGRYHAWTMAEALAHTGANVQVVTNNVPLFYTDFQRYRAHGNVQVWLAERFAKDLPGDPCDLVVVVPGMDREDTVYRSALSFAALRAAPVVLLNFETPNWFNALSPAPRDEDLWRHWKTTAEFCSVILSSTKESMRHARAYYPDTPWLEHRYAWPGLNTDAAERTMDVKREKRLLFLSARNTYGEHKGLADIPALFGPYLRGYTAAVICGGDDLPESFRLAMEAQAQRYDITLEYLDRISDVEKFAEYRRAAAVLFPSMFEGFGYPPVEALYCGTPCVAFDLPVLRETGGGDYRLAPVGDLEALRELLKGVLTTETKPFARDVSEFGFEAYAMRLDTIVEDVLRRPAPWLSLGGREERIEAIDRAFRQAHERVQATRVVKESADIVPPASA